MRILLLLADLLGAHADEIKIGVVDTERILAESAPAVRALKKIEKEFLPRDQEIKKMASQAKVLQDLLEKDGKTHAGSGSAQ